MKAFKLHWFPLPILALFLFPTLLYAQQNLHYRISTSVETLADGYRYTWRVYNVDRGFSDGQYWVGLDGLFITVPIATRVIDYACPPPGIGGYGGSWYFRQEYGEYYTESGKLVAPAPPVLSITLKRTFLDGRRMGILPWSPWVQPARCSAVAHKRSYAGSPFEQSSDDASAEIAGSSRRGDGRGIHAPILEKGQRRCKVGERRTFIFLSRSG